MWKDEYPEKEEGFVITNLFTGGPALTETSAQRCRWKKKGRSVILAYIRGVYEELVHVEKIPKKT